MIADLHIVHRPKPHVFSGSVAQAPLWSTCLRSLAFTHTPPSEVESTDQVYRQEEAYRFLLEVICGLHSPIVGETEVLGQFKAFAQQWTALEPKRASLVQALLNDAKAIRTRHLSHLGNQSYGSWVRKNLRAVRVHVIGGGLLATDVLPYLAKNGREVLLHVRSPEKARHLVAGAVCDLATSKFDGGAVIVAAPVSGAWLRRWLGDPSQLVQLFDLRDTALTDFVYQPGSREGLYLLQDIFAEIEATKSKLGQVLEDVRADIGLRVAKVSERSHLRPQGWDDLCA